MREYAEIAAQEMADALRLVKRITSPAARTISPATTFRDKEEILQLATSEGLVEGDHRHAERHAEGHRHGPPGREPACARRPGSGKTRVVASHRLPVVCAAPAGRGDHRAHLQPACGQRELQAPGLPWSATMRSGSLWLTYHAMAMRLTGTQFLIAATRWKRASWMPFLTALRNCWRAAVGRARTIFARASLGVSPF